MRLLVPFMDAQLVLASDEPAVKTERSRSSVAGGKIGKECHLWLGVLRRRLFAI